MSRLDKGDVADARRFLKKGRLAVVDGQIVPDPTRARKRPVDPDTLRVYVEALEFLFNAAPGLADLMERQPRKPARNASGTGSSKGLKPYECWSREDAGNWYRSSGAWGFTGEDSRPSAAEDYRHARSEPAAVAAIAEAVNAPDTYGIGQPRGWNIFPADKTRSPHMLELCCLCGDPLPLRRDAEGHAYFGRGRPRKYCPDGCKETVRYARDRAVRAAQAPEPDVKPFDLSGIYLSGIGLLDIPPADWNYLQPRRDPGLFAEPVPQPRIVVPEVPQIRIWREPIAEQPIVRREGRTPGGSGPRLDVDLFWPWFPIDSGRFYKAQVVPGAIKGERPMLVDNWAEDERELRPLGEDLQPVARAEANDRPRRVLVPTPERPRTLLAGPAPEVRQRLPYLHASPRSRTGIGDTPGDFVRYPLQLHTFVQSKLCGVNRGIGPRSVEASADRIARRWRQYGAGGVKSPRQLRAERLAPDWDAVSVWWRPTPRVLGRLSVTDLQVSGLGGNVWRIAEGRHPEGNVETHP